MSDDATPPVPSGSDSEFLRILLVGMDKRADRIETRLGGIEGTQSEILRLQIGQGRDLAGHLATPHAPISPAPAPKLEPPTGPEGGKPDANGITDARVEQAMERVFFKWLWEHKKAAGLALTFLGLGGGGHWAVTGCNGKPIASFSAAPTPTGIADSRAAPSYRNPRISPDARPD